MIVEIDFNLQRTTGAEEDLDALPQHPNLTYSVMVYIFMALYRYDLDYLWPI